MSNDLVQRLRLHGKGECKCNHCTAPVEAADHIEALEGTLRIIAKQDPRASNKLAASMRDIAIRALGAKP